MRESSSRSKQRDKTSVRGKRKRVQGGKENGGGRSRKTAAYTERISPEWFSKIELKENQQIKRAKN